MEKHYKDIITGQTECGDFGVRVGDLEEVTCLKCLNSIKEEWERQVKSFKGQPKKNAILGLKYTKKVIVRLLKKEIKQVRFEMQHPLNKGNSDGDYWENKLDELKEEIEDLKDE